MSESKSTTETVEETSRLHPVVESVRVFIEEVLTQEEHVARVMSILGVMPKEAILAAAERIQYHMALSDNQKEDTDSTEKAEVTKD